MKEEEEEDQEEEDEEDEAEEGGSLLYLGSDPHVKGGRKSVAQWQA